MVKIARKKILPLRTYSAFLITLNVNNKKQISEDELHEYEANLRESIDVVFGENLVKFKEDIVNDTAYDFDVEVGEYEGKVHSHIFLECNHNESNSLNIDIPDLRREFKERLVGGNFYLNVKRVTNIKSLNEYIHKKYEGVVHEKGIDEGHGELAHVEYKRYEKVGMVGIGAVVGVALSLLFWMKK